MTRDEIRSRIVEIGVIPGIRVGCAEDALMAAEAVAKGGIPIVEVTMTVPGAIDVITTLARERPGILVGAGTIWDRDTAERCLAAGARFLTSTGLYLDLIDVAKSAQAVVFPGALTPTEVMQAWKAGADFVKIFPCSQVGGPAYIRALKAPFPNIPLIASGGVNQQNVGEFIAAGAMAVGVGGHLIPKRAIELKQPHRIHELAHRFSTSVRTARGELAPG